MLLRALAMLTFLLAGAAEARAACARLDRVVIAPPPVDDWALADWLGAQATRELVRRQKDKKCLSVRKLSDSAPAFDMVGSTTSFPRAPDTFGARQILFLYERLEATHVLFLDAPTPDGRMRAQVYAIRDKSRLVVERTYTQQLDRKAVAAHRTPSWKRFMARIAPNAVELGFSNTDVYFDVNGAYGGRDVKMHESNLLPPVLSSLAVTRVEHRRGFGLFDWAGSIFPGTYFFGIDQDNTYTKKSETPGSEALPTYLSYHIETYGACGTANAQGSVFSPIGTTYFGLGFGPCLLWLRTADRDATWYGKTAVRFFLGHRIFISDRIFADLDLDTLIFNQPLMKSKYARAEQVERFGLSFGWYIADAEQIAASVLEWFF